MATISITLDKKYTSDSDNEQRIFFKDSKIGWKAILADPNHRHYNGVTQYDYLETYGLTFSGWARPVLDKLVDKWDHTNVNNVDYEETLAREASLQVGRAFYKRKATLKLRRIQVVNRGKVPVSPHALEDLVEEPPHSKEFVAITNESASVIYLNHLVAFKPHRREPLLKIANKYGLP